MNCCFPYQNLIPFRKSVRENEINLVFPSQAQVPLTVVEVSGVHTHGMYERSWLKSLRVMLNVKVFAPQDLQANGQRLAGRTDEHDRLQRSICYSYGSKIGILAFTLPDAWH